MKPFAGIFFTVLLSTVAHAKCANELYEVSGNVKDSTDFSPIAGAEVVLTWSELGGAVSQTLTAKTNTVGNFRARIRFYTWSGMVGSSDRCQAKLTSISLSVSASGFESEVGEQAITGSATTANYSLKRTAVNRHGVH